MINNRSCFLFEMGVLEGEHIVGDSIHRDSRKRKKCTTARERRNQ